MPSLEFTTDMANKQDSLRVGIYAKGQKPIFDPHNVLLYNYGVPVTIAPWLIGASLSGSGRISGRKSLS